MTSFIQFLVKNSHFAILLVIILFFYGITSLSQLKITQDPAIEYAQIEGKFFLPGALPSDLQKNLIYPIEKELRSLEDVIDFKTHMEHGWASLWIRFNPNTDIDKQLREVESRINRIRRKLPSNMDFYLKQVTLVDLMPAFMLAVQQPDNSVKAQDNLAFDLIDALQKVPNLVKIELIRSDQELMIELDMTRLAWLGISPQQVAEQLQAYNRFSASGQLRVNQSYFRFSGPNRLLQDIEDFQNIQLTTAESGSVALHEVAQVYQRDQAPAILTRFNGKAAAFIRIGVSGQVNIVDVEKKVQAVIDQFRQAHADQVNVDWIFSQADGVGSLVVKLLVSFAQGLLILLLVLMFSVGYRSTLIIASLLPLSFFAAVVLFSFTDYGIQQVSIAGFIIALGLIVDNGIVVTENTYLLQNYQNYTRSNAAVEGCSKAIGPLFSSTLTTILALAPIFFLTSNTGSYLHSLSVSIWLSLLASLFIAITFVTLLLAKIGTIGPLWKLPQLPSFLIFLIPFRDNIYQKILKVLLRWRLMTLLLALVCLGGALYAATLLKVEVFPVSGDPYITVNVNFPKRLDENSQRELAGKIEKILLKRPEIKQVSTINADNFPLLNVSMNGYGDLVILCETQRGDEPYLSDLIAQLEKNLLPLKQYADITLSMFKFEGGLEYRSPFTLHLSGSNSDQLKTFALSLNDVLLEMPEITSIKNPIKPKMPNLQLQYDTQAAELLGINKQQVDTLLDQLTYGQEIDRFRDQHGREFFVLLGIHKDLKNPLQVLREIMLVNNQGRNIPLSEVVKPTFYEGESQITHQLFQPYVSIDIWPRTDLTPELAAAKMMDKIAKLPRPDSIQIKIGGALENKSKEFEGLGKNTLMIALLIFAIFVLQFRSFSQPLIIFSAVPLCLIGALSALYIFDQTMTFLAAVGVTSLMGIVVNDSILLVDEANRLHQKTPEQSMGEIAVEAGRQRFMPVLLTSVTTIASLIPLAFGDSLFKTMAIAIIGGMVSSTLLILLVVPVLFSLFSNSRKVGSDDG